MEPFNNSNGKYVVQSFTVYEHSIENFHGLYIMPLFSIMQKLVSRNEHFIVRYPDFMPV